VTEACVVGIPDAMKGQLPFAFVGVSSSSSSSSDDDEQLFRELNGLVRRQVGGIASLGGLIRGQGMIPKTRSGKTLRRCLRDMLENAVHGEFDKEVAVPSTVEDASVVEVARARIREYFEQKAGGRHGAIEQRAKAKL